MRLFCTGEAHQGGDDRQLCPHCYYRGGVEDVQVCDAQYSDGSTWDITVTLSPNGSVGWVTGGSDNH